jgi:hypothetical protein
MALRAFFDETGTHDGHPLTAVAGFLFDTAGLNKFEVDWRKRTVDLKGPFHTTDCVRGRGAFEGWPEPQRLLLLHDLPEIIIRTRICAVISFIASDEYDQWCRENPRYVPCIGSPYTVCLMKCVETAGLVARQNRFEGDIDYIFESGCDKQQEASEFMVRLDQNPKLKAGLRIGSWGFAPKGREPALCSADFLCWEWQKNYVRAMQNPNITWSWNSEFKILLSPNPTEIYHQRISKENLNSQAMTNAAHGIHGGEARSDPTDEV